MNIQRFTGSDSRVAMRKVREALGDDALILSNRQVADGIEIIAADGSDDMLFGKTDNAVIESSQVKDAPELKAAMPKVETEASIASELLPELVSINDFIKPENRTTQAPEPAASQVTPIPDIYNDVPYAGLGAATPNDQQTQAEPPVLEPVIAHNAAAVGAATTAINTGKQTSNFTDSITKAKTDLKKLNGNKKETEQAENEQISIMRAELSRLRGMMENQFSNMHMGLWAQNSPARAAVLKRMTELGLTDSLATKIVSSLKNIDDVTPQVSARDALATLAKQIRVTGDKISERGGTFVFIGPAGAGKTTTIAKIALQFTRQHGTDDIVLISTDTSRFGAHEQLAAYGRLLGVPVIRATDNEQIRELIAAMQDKKLVLVDTAGLTQQNLRDPESITTMHLQIPNIQHYLVLPATAQYQTLDRVISSLATKEIAGAIMTKVDEAANLGEILSTAISNRFPIAYWTEEQKITSSLQVANPRRLVEKAVSVLRTQSSGNTFSKAADNSNHTQNPRHQQQ